MKKVLSIAVSAVLLISSVASATEFTDIDRHWAKDIIINLADKGIVHGVSDTEFNPDGTVTRAEFLKMAMDVVGIEGTAYRSGECLDVTASDWYGPCVQSALDRGLIPENMIVDFASKISENKGVVYTGRFDGDKAIKREEMAYIAQSMYQYTRDEDTMLDMYNPTDMQFTDLSRISHWAFKGVQYAYSNKLISGMEDDTFRPQDTATRAQAATIISKILEATE